MRLIPDMCYGFRASILFHSRLTAIYLFPCCNSIVMRLEDLTVAFIIREILFLGWFDLWFKLIVPFIAEPKFELLKIKIYSHLFFPLVKELS